MKIEKEHKNKSIGCTVDTCKFHSRPDNYCTLNNIEVGSCMHQPKEVDATCCNSFQVKTTF